MAKRQEILERLNISSLLQELLPTAKHAGKNKLLARCPWSERHRNFDASPSFMAFTTDGDFKCLACLEKGSIFDLFGKVHGLDYKGAITELSRRVGLEPSKSLRRVTGFYIYQDSSGKPLYWKERIEPGKNAGSKDFLFFHGSGVEPGKAFFLTRDNRRLHYGRGGDPVLYRLPEVLDDTNVIFTEGEKHADLLHEWGLTATTLDSGSQSRLTSSMIEQLTGKKIVILPDNDQPGRDYAERIAADIIHVAESVKILELPDLLEKGDIIDWIKIPTNDKTRLLGLIDNCEECKLESRLMATSTQDKPVEEKSENIPQPHKNRSFPRLYMDLDLLLNDPRRYQFKRGLSPLYDSLVLHIARSPGARFPNLPRAVATVLEIDETSAQNLIATALQHGMLVCDGEGNLTHPMVTVQYNKAVELCRINAENGAKGGKGSSVKNKQKKLSKRSLSN